jgi:hypothetical protein
MHRLATLLVMLLALAGTGSALAQAAPMPNCEADEHRQFDFWIGHWTVTNPSGGTAGDSRVESILDGCGLLESWTGAKGARGKSLNLYNRATSAWEQYYIDNQGNRLLLRGGIRDGAMVMESVEDGGGAATQRVTWTPNADGSVRQHWESTADGGATWTTQFDGTYARLVDVDRAE